MSREHGFKSCLFSVTSINITLHRTGKRKRPKNAFHIPLDNTHSSAESAWLALGTGLFLVQGMAAEAPELEGEAKTETHLGDR